MTIGSMLGDIVKSLVTKPDTMKYPADKKSPPMGLRGALVWNAENCTGCRLCIVDCPSSAFELYTIDKSKKKFVMRYNVGKCIFCAQCMRSCKFDCFEVTNTRWELASMSKEKFEIYYGDQKDIQSVIEGLA